MPTDTMPIIQDCRIYLVDRQTPADAFYKAIKCHLVVDGQAYGALFELESLEPAHVLKGLEMACRSMSETLKKLSGAEQPGPQETAG